MHKIQIIFRIQLQKHAFRDKIAEGGDAIMIKFRTKVLLAMNDMNQKDLAEQTGVRPSTISAMCTGAAKHIPVDVLDKICTVLKCQPGDLIEHIPEEE